jgi:chitinase
MACQRSPDLTVPLAAPFPTPKRSLRLPQPPIGTFFRSASRAPPEADMRNLLSMKICKPQFGKCIAALCLAATLPALAQQADWAPKPERPAPPRIVGYYTQGSVYNNFFVKNLVTSGSARVLTQIDYAFAALSNNQCASADTYADYQDPLTADETVDGKADSMAPGAFVGNFRQLQELKQRYPNIKIVMSIGGGSANPLDFSTVSDAANRKAFVKSCINMYIKGQFGPGIREPGIFDGFDIDWEYPASESDEEGMTALLAEFRSQMDAIRPGMMLSIASSAGSWAYQYIDFKAVQKSLDFFGLMEYDFDGPWNDTTGLVAPLYQAKGDPDPTNNAAWAVEQYLAMGVKPEKIVFGLPFYGYEWTDVTNTDHGLFQAGTPVGDGSGYNAIVPLESSFTKYRDPTTQAPWLYDGTSFWTYDDPTSLAFKMSYARKQKLGGLMVWDLSGDMPDGQLLKTSASTLAGSR